jgi:hypothetical protein
LEIWSKIFISDPDFYQSRIQGSKRHRIPDPDPQICLYLKFKKNLMFFAGGDAAEVILPATACSAGQQGGAGHLRARPHCRPLQVGSHPCSCCSSL